MSGHARVNWGPIIGALAGAGLMAALVFVQGRSPLAADAERTPALHGTVDTAWDAVGRLVDEGAHQLGLK